MNLKNKLGLVALCMLATVAMAPTASAMYPILVTHNDGPYEPKCQQSDPNCRPDNDQGCDATLAVSCEYDNEQCYWGPDGWLWCRQNNHDCLVNLLDRCYLEG